MEWHKTMFLIICIFNLLHFISTNDEWRMTENASECEPFDLCQCEFVGNRNEYLCDINSNSSELVIRPDTQTVKILCSDYKQSEKFDLYIIRQFVSVLENNNIEMVFVSCSMQLSELVQITEGMNISSLQLTASLSQNSFLHSSDELDKFPSLKKVSLRRNRLSEMSREFFHKIGKNLEVVDLSGNLLSTIPDCFFNSTPNAKVINLGSNKIAVLKDSLGYLPKLKTLNLYNNELMLLTQDVFIGAPNIIELNLQGNKLQSLLVDTFVPLVKLQTLYLFSNQLQTLPESLFFSNVNLLQLELQDNPLLSDLPHDLLKNTNQINQINLSRCNLSFLPERFFQNLPNLKKVLLNDNKLSKLEDNLFINSSLEYLDLSKNKLIDLPKDLVSGKRSLVHLDLSNNQLISLSDDFFTNLKSVTMLNLSHNNFTRFTYNQFQHLYQLKELFLQNNNIEHIQQQTFTVLFNLSLLDLSHNQLKDLDFQLPALLESINLSFNNFNEMPIYWQPMLYQLHWLDLSHNKIKHVSTSNLQFASNKATINLEFNEIEIVDLSDELSETNNESKRTLIKLSHNPLKCDCKVQFLIEHLANELQAPNIWFHIDAQELKCKSPLSVYNQSIASLDARKLMCNISDECPSLCACMRDARNTQRIVRCLNVDLQKIPKPVPPQITTLDLTGNFLKSLEGLEDAAWRNLTNLILTGNQFEQINISYLPKNLRSLALDRNKLSQLDIRDLEALSRYNLKEIKLGNNPWNCDCNNFDLQNWLSQPDNTVTDASKMMCNNIHNMTVGKYRCIAFPSLFLGLALAAVFLSLILCMGGIAYYKYLHEVRVWLYSQKCCLRLISEEDVDAGKEFDAFVSFSQEDVDWVIKELIPELEQREPHYRLCVHYRDWIVGEWIPDQIVRSVEASCRTIVILSQNFLQSIWGKWEFKTAHHQALKDNMNRVIVIVLGEIPPKEEMDPEMRTYVGLNTYLRWGDPWFWKKLRYAMPHRTNSQNVLRSRNRQYWTSPVNLPPL